MVKNIKFILACFVFTTVTACSETKEVKIEDKTAVATDADKDVNVNVKVDQAGQVPAATQDTTNVVVKNESSKEVASMNASLLKLQDQLKTANAQSKAEINQQIAKMNADKMKLEKQVTDLQNQNKTMQQQTQQANAAKLAQENLSMTKDQYKNNTNLRLENLDTKITDLKTKTDSLSDPSKTTLTTEVIRLEDKKSEIQTKLSDIDTATDINSFKTVKAQVDTMIADLDKKYTVLSAKPEFVR